MRHLAEHTLARNADPAAQNDPVEGRLTVRRWYEVAAALPQGFVRQSVNGLSARRFIEAVLWIAATDSTWPELPAAYGNHHAVYQRFTRWVRLDVWTVVSLHMKGDVRAEALDRIVRQQQAIVARRGPSPATRKVVTETTNEAAATNAGQVAAVKVPFHLRAIGVAQVAHLLGLAAKQVRAASSQDDFPTRISARPDTWVAGEILAWRDAHRVDEEDNGPQGSMRNKNAMTAGDSDALQS